MRNLIAAPVILLAVILQSAIVSRIYVLSGTPDLPLVMLAAWALQGQVRTAWHWAIATGLLVGFVSAIVWFVPVIAYLAIVILAQLLQRRVWQAPLLAMFVVTFFGTIIVYLLSFSALRLTGVPLPFSDTVGLLALPGVLMNLLLAIPAYAVMQDLARWVHPAPEVQ